MSVIAREVTGIPQAYDPAHDHGQATRNADPAWIRQVRARRPRVRPGPARGRQTAATGGGRSCTSRGSRSRSSPRAPRGRSSATLPTRSDGARAGSGTARSCPAKTRFSDLERSKPLWTNVLFGVLAAAPIPQRVASSESETVSVAWGLTPTQREVENAWKCLPSWEAADRFVPAGRGRRGGRRAGDLADIGLVGDGEEPRVAPCNPRHPWSTARRRRPTRSPPFTRPRRRRSRPFTRPRRRRSRPFTRPRRRRSRPFTRPHRAGRGVHAPPPPVACTRATAAGRGVEGSAAGRARRGHKIA